jgi:hypothetical protein
MKKALPLLFLLLSLSALAFTQTTLTCDSSTNLDTNRNVCTNFTTKPTSSQRDFYMDYEDGQSMNPDFTAGFFILNAYPPAQVDIPYDPLIIKGYVAFEGTDASVLNGYDTSSVIAGAACGRMPCAHNFYTARYVLNQLVPAARTASDYPYHWSGTFTITYTITGEHCRYGVCIPVYSGGEGSVELSAIHD